MNDTQSVHRISAFAKSQETLGTAFDLQSGMDVPRVDPNKATDKQTTNHKAGYDNTRPFLKENASW